MSPVLRKKLMKALRNQDLRQEYLAFRADSQQEEDEGRAFNSAIWLWSILGATIAVPAIFYGGLNNEQQLVIGGIITLGVGILIGVLKAVLSGRHATFGPLPLRLYILPSFAVSGTFRPQKAKQPSEAPDGSKSEN